MGNPNVGMGFYRFEIIRLSPERAKRYIQPGDFHSEIPLEEGEGVVASQKIPFRADSAYWLNLHDADMISRGEPPAEMQRGFESRRSQLVFWKDRGRFSFSVYPADNVPTNLDAASRAASLLSRSARFLIPEGEAIRSIAVGDVNADGKSDIFVSLTDGGAYVFQQIPNVQGMALCGPTYCQPLWHRK